MKLHPETGLHYIMTFPRRAPAFADIHDMYGHFGKTHPWVSVLNHVDLQQRMEEIARDKRYFVTIWGVRAPTPPAVREATFARAYTEALDADRSKMLQNHQHWLDYTVNQVRHVDGTFGHTPWMASQFDGHVLPWGWDPTVMGTPRHGPKNHRFTYVGVMAGKRSWVCPVMKGVLGDEYNDASGQWQRRVLDTLNDSAGYLYLTHSDVHSFSTPRIWQAVATSAAMITEGGKDCWPMTEDMYVPLPVITQANVMEVARFVGALSDTELEQVSRRLHDALRHYTIGHVVESYLVPASMKIVAKR